MRALPVLGADTIVVLDGVVFGKPLDKADGMRMLLALGGHTHHVLTAVALAMPDDEAGGGPAALAMSDTAVTMRAITPAEAEAYWASGEPAGKAGGYAIQGLGARLHCTTSTAAIPASWVCRCTKRRNCCSLTACTEGS